MPNDAPIIDPAAAPAAPAPAAAAPPAEPAAFDWKAAGGLDDAGSAFVAERQWKNPADVITSYRNLEKLTGNLNQIMKVPTDDNADAWNAVYDRLGRPKDAKDYQLPVPQGDKGEFAGVASQWMHEAGLNPRQARALAEKWNAHIAGAQTQQQEATTAKHGEEVKALREAWGANYDAHAEVADRAATTFGMTEEQLVGLKNTMGAAGAMKFLHNIGSKIGTEGEFHTGGTGGGAGLTAEQAKAKIGELMGDKTFAARFNSPDAATRAQARDEMAKLNKLAYQGTVDLTVKSNRG